MDFIYFGLTVEVFLGREIEYIVTVCVCEKKMKQLRIMVSSLFLYVSVTLPPLHQLEIRQII